MDWIYGLDVWTVLEFVHVDLAHTRGGVLRESSQFLVERYLSENPSRLKHLKTETPENRNT